MHSVSVNVEPAQFLAGWRPETGAVFLPALSEARVGEVAAVRVGLFGQPVRATLFGKIAAVRKLGRPALPPGVEIALDRASLPAAGFLAVAARGEPIDFKERAPRLAAERRLLLVRDGATVDARTLNLSEGGCAVRWPGQLPLVGDVLGLKLGEGFFAPSAQAVVCWNQPGEEAERSVGLRVIASGRGSRAWRALLAEVVRSGARAA